jgi:hypothetical protein
MAGTVDVKAVTAEVGRSALRTTLKQFAEAGPMESSYQGFQGDLKAKGALEGMAKEVADLSEGDKLAEVLSRFFVVIIMQIPPEQQSGVVFQLYTHLRATGLMEPVKLNLGSIVDLSGKRIPPKGGE